MQIQIQYKYNYKTRSQNQQGWDGGCHLLGRVPLNLYHVHMLSVTTICCQLNNIFPDLRTDGCDDRGGTQPSRLHRCHQQGRHCLQGCHHRQPHHHHPNHQPHHQHHIRHYYHVQFANKIGTIQIDNVV